MSASKTTLVTTSISFLEILHDAYTKGAQTEFNLQLLF